MKLIKDGIAKTIPDAKAEEYKAAGWAELMAKKPEAMPEPAPEKPAKKSSGRGKKEA